MSSYAIRSWYAHELPEQYHGFVIGKWLVQAYRKNDFFKLIDPDVYFSVYKIYITKLMSEADCVVRLATLIDDDDVALGFAAHRSNILDFIYVQMDLRGQGIARCLLPKGIDTITHLTKDGLAIWGKQKYSHWKFNPFA
jgi:hypothetical protein